MKNEFRFTAPLRIYSIKESKRPTKLSVQLPDKNLVVTMSIRGDRISISDQQIVTTEVGRRKLFWNGTRLQFNKSYKCEGWSWRDAFSKYVSDWYCKIGEQVM